MNVPVFGNSRPANDRRMCRANHARGYGIRSILLTVAAVIGCDAFAETAVMETGDPGMRAVSTDMEDGVEKTALPLTIEDDEYTITRQHQAANPCDRSLDEYNYDLSWYDDTQIYINSRFCEPALWFDNFFADDRIIEEGVAGTYIRLRNEFYLDEEEDFDLKIGLSASVELPGVEHRLRLTFLSDEDEDLRDIAPGNGEDTTNALGLQFDMLERLRSKLSLSVSLSPKIRLRYRYTYPATDTITLRYTQEIQRKKGINSALSRFDFEKLFHHYVLFRSISEGRVSEEYDGVDWLQALVLYHRLDKKTSMSYETSASGITEPVSLTTDYRVAVRFRKNFHRPWLFYEVSPEYTWPITLSEDRQSVLIDRRSKWQIFFRVEIHFGNAENRRYRDYY
jgi:hypothetical protein